MRFNQYNTLVEAVKVLRKRGFIHNFKLEEQSMRCINTGKLYAAKEMEIVEYHRLEGQSNPSDMSIVFAVTCRDGERGVVVSSYGTYADLKLMEFMDKVKIANREENPN